MTISNVRGNIYLDQFNKRSIDLISKIYGMIAWLMGINRLTMFFKLGTKSKILTLAYSLFFNSLLFYFVLKSNTSNVYMKFFNITEYLLCAFIAFIYNETLLKFYEGLSQFDNEITFKSSVTSKSVVNFLQAVFNLILVIILNSCCNNIEHLGNVTADVIPAHLTHVWEIHYYVHLFELLKLRLKSVRVLLLASFPTNVVVDITCCSENDLCKENIVTLVNNNKKNTVRKLLNLYSKIITIYDFLNAALQWQLLLIISTTFLVMLVWTYDAVLHIINDEYTLIEGLFDMVLFFALIAPMFTICGSGQGIHDEVMLLQNALYPRIYKNTFDKKNRSVASSLLALTEVRTLSFSVFRMFDLNTSFPFKFFGLLASYLVILLQFKKVTNFK
nr:gustatory receptor 16 [Papilio polytes]